MTAETPPQAGGEEVGAPGSAARGGLLRDLAGTLGGAPAGVETVLDVVDLALASLPVSVIVVEAAPGYRVVFANQHATAIAAPRMRPLAGRLWTELWPRDDHADAAELLHAAARSGLPQRRRGVRYSGLDHPRVTLPDAATVWDYDVLPLRRGDEVTHLVVLGWDVTERARSGARISSTLRRAASALTTIAQQSVTDDDREAVMGRLSETVARLAGAGRSAFLLLDPEAATLSAVRAAHGLSDEELGLLVDLPCDPEASNSAGRVVHRDEVHRTPGFDFAGVGHADAAGGRLIVRDSIAVSWRLGERPLGVVVAYDSLEGEGFDDEAEWVMRMSATTAALLWRQRETDEARRAATAEREAALLDAASRSARLEHTKAEFLNLAAHELRSPLGVIKGYLSMLLDGSLGEVGNATVRSAVELVVGKANEMGRIVDDMLETARLDAGAVDLQLEELDLVEVVAAAVAETASLVDAAHEVRVTPPPQPVRVSVDRRRIVTVVVNLVDNALKYSPRGGVVEVTWGADDGEARLEVRDQGLGIADRDLATLFTRFGRVVTAETSHIRGTGLGLHLCRELVHRHGGEIGVSSVAGSGSVFTVLLPAVVA